MKTATITWITYNNYGTALQAYALQKYLLDSGVDNVIISDRYIIQSQTSQSAAVLASGVQSKKCSRIRYYGRHPIQLCIQLYNIFKARKQEYIQKPYIESQRLFERFKERELQILYGLKREDMPKLNSQFDLFVCGSDQIWSVLGHNFNGYFYLDFATKKRWLMRPVLGRQRFLRSSKCRFWNI